MARFPDAIILCVFITVEAVDDDDDVVFVVVVIHIAPHYINIYRTLHMLRQTSLTDVSDLPTEKNKIETTNSFGARRLTVWFLFYIISFFSSFLCVYN